MIKPITESAFIILKQLPAFFNSKEKEKGSSLRLTFVIKRFCEFVMGKGPVVMEPHQDRRVSIWRIRFCPQALKISRLWAYFATPAKRLAFLRMVCNPFIRGIQRGI